uniref:Uncharacterized protein n=1 Tax=Physcomitrium patens TaxID=3218 RepID=A0A2K1JZ26_PHYPA|nr:hypothetical protein PHYPA_013896 [Physcomitrium patens]
MLAKHTLLRCIPRVLPCPTARTLWKRPNFSVTNTPVDNPSLCCYAENST